MKVILYMAVSVDGFIAKKNGDSDWTSKIDSVIFERKIKEMGCLIVGRRTFDQFYGDLYPIRGVTNIVLTTNSSRKSEEGTIYATSPKEALRVAQEKGYEKVLLIGGGTTNGLFLKENLIDEIFLSVHPLVLSQGIKLFEKCDIGVKLKLLEVKQLKEDLVQFHYLVKK